MLILDLWGISFHAVIVFGLGKNLLFKSVLGHCEQYDPITLNIILILFDVFDIFFDISGISLDVTSIIAYFSTKSTNVASIT